MRANEKRKHRAMEVIVDKKFFVQIIQGGVHKLRLQDEVGRWLSKCQQMLTEVGRWSVLCKR